MEDSIAREKSYRFAIKIIKFYKYLIYQKKEYVMAKQLLRSGASIGANIEEAIGGQSKKDFLSKASIAYKEVRETHYWLRLINDSLSINKEEISILLSDCNELLRIIGSILITTKRNLNCQLLSLNFLKK